MKLLDYFFYILANSFTSIKGDLDDWDARLKACGFLSLFLVGLTLVVFAAGGLITDNDVSALLKNEYFFLYYLGYAIGVGCLIYVRYLNNSKKYLEIVEWRNKLAKKERTVMYTVFLILFWSMPILVFVTYRLYLFGQVKWW